MTSADLSLSTALRVATSDLHTQAESHPFQRALVQGELPRDLFTRQMSQLLLVHTALEKALHHAAIENTDIASVVREEQFQQPRLVRDLAHVGFDPAKAAATTATQAVCSLIERLAATNPIALLGALYVFEGSNNGARFIARAVRKAYNIEELEGISYLDPYGEAQREKWGEFKAAMDALVLSDDDIESVVATAKQMFRAINAMGDDLLSETPTSKI